MLVIVFMENLFISDIKKVAILNNNIEKFDRYVLREGKYSFSLPEGWDIDSKGNNNDVIVTFNNKKDIYGSISILNNSVDNIKEGIVDQVDKVKMHTANLLAMVTRLRQATEFPQLLTSDKNIKSNNNFGLAFFSEFS